MLRGLSMMQRTVHRNMGIHQKQMMLHMERLSTGKRINRAADDPAGLAISEKMRGQIRGLQQAQRNVLDGISLIRTAEGALNEKHSILHRVRELSVQAANDTLTNGDREVIEYEVDQLLEQLGVMKRDTEFNTHALLEGGDLKLQTGANSGQSMTITLPDTNLSMLEDLDLSTREGADKAIGLLDEAINHISSERSRMGAYENRLEHTYNNLTNYEMNLTAAESRIRDADMAKEMMGYIKSQTLYQVSIMMMAHLNQQHSQILKLLVIK